MTKIRSGRSAHTCVHRDLAVGFRCEGFHQQYCMADLFSSKLFEKLSPGPKNFLERRVSPFSAICDKNPVLKLNIVKVTRICVTQITLSSGAPL